MAVHLITAPRLMACAVLGLASMSALALGPKAPFEPPRAASAPAAADAASAADGSDATVLAASGLTGLRLRNHPMAFIDGAWARVGDQVRGARVEIIRSTGAWLRHSNGQVELLPWNAMPTAQPKPVRTSTP